MSWGYLPMIGHVLFGPGGPLGIDKVHSQLATALCKRKTERNQREAESAERSTMQPQRRCVPLGSIIKLSVGRRGLNALQTERGRDVQPHMHLLTTSYFHSHEWGPHTVSPHCCQRVRAKTFHNMSSTQCREKVFLGFALSRTRREDRVCLQAARELQRELWRKKDGSPFLRNLESSVILPSVLHVVSCSFYTMFAKSFTATLVLLLLFLTAAAAAFVLMNIWKNGWRSEGDGGRSPH